MKVSLIECKDYYQVDRAIEELLDLLGGLNRFIRPGDKVLIKPNLSDPMPPDKAGTTHPEIIKSVVTQVQKITPNVWIGEQSASSMKGTTQQSYNISGTEEVVRITGCLFRNLQEEKFIVTDIPDYRVLEKTDFAEAALDADIIINLPKFKSHGITYVTGAVKNLFGLLHPDERQYMHRNFKDIEQFSQGIVDIYSFFKPTINIMDAVIAMEGDEGPSYGNPVHIGYVIASVDGVSVDAVASYLTGHKPMDILTTRYAHQRKIGIGKFSDIEILGDKPKIKNFEQHTIYKNRNDEFKGKMQPLISEKCKLCGACYAACPNNAISTKPYKIIEKNCIQCLCCLEVCIHEAITLRNIQSENKNANLRLGRACNQNCLFCTVANDPETELSTAEAKDKITYLVGQGVNEISFTGGEPTLRKDLAELFRFARESGITRIDMQTNGVKLEEKNVELLKKAGLKSVLLAFHSHKKEILDKLTASKDYDKTLKGISNIVKHGIQLHISHVINSENYKYLKDFAVFMKEIDSSVHLYFQFIRPNGNTQENKGLVPKLSEIEIYLDECLNYCQEEGMSFSVEGVPLCYMQDFVSHCSETQRMKKNAQIYVGQGKSKHEDLHAYIHSELKCKSDDCNICSANTSCAGIWKEYAEIHGTDELYPLFQRLK